MSAHLLCLLLLAIRLSDSLFESIKKPGFSDEDFDKDQSCSAQYDTPKINTYRGRTVVLGCKEDCDVVLVQSCAKSYDVSYFNVIATYTFGQDTLILTNVRVTRSPKKVTFDSKSVWTNSTTIRKDCYSGQQMCIYYTPNERNQSLRKVEVRIRNTIRVTIGVDTSDNVRLHIYPSDRIRSRVCGVCGNHDGVIDHEDFVTNLFIKYAEGDILSEESKAIFRLPESCKNPRFMTLFLRFTDNNKQLINACEADGDDTEDLLKVMEKICKVEDGICPVVNDLASKCDLEENYVFKLPNLKYCCVAKTNGCSAATTSAEPELSKIPSTATASLAHEHIDSTTAESDPKAEDTKPMKTWRFDTPEEFVEARRKAARASTVCIAFSTCTLSFVMLIY